MTELDSIFTTVLETTTDLCDTAKFGLILEIFSRMDSGESRVATVAGLQAYVTAEQENPARQNTTH